MSFSNVVFRGIASAPRSPGRVGRSCAVIELSRRTWLTTACVVLVAGSAFAAAPVRKNTPPVAIIESPKDGTVYAAGATVLLAGKATDAEDPDSRLSYLWRVDGVHSG